MMATKHARKYSMKKLKEECQRRRAMLTGYPMGEGLLVTDEELASVWPGGSANKLRGYDAWIEAFSQLVSFARRLEAHEARKRHEVGDGAFEAAVRAAGLAQAELVVCSDGVGRYVYPKGLWALSWLEGFGEVVARTLPPVSIDELTDAMMHPLLRTRAVCAWAWVLTTDGAGVPWSDDTPTIEPPAWTATLAPEDLLALDAAHRRVNGDRLSTMAAAFPAENGAKSRLAIGGMLAGYAHEHGIPTSEVMRKLSVGEVVAGAMATHEAYRVAKENADAQRSRETR